MLQTSDFHSVPLGSLGLGAQSQTANDPQMKSEVGLGGGLFFETRSFHAWTVDFFSGCTWIQILSVQKTLGDGGAFYGKGTPKV